MSEREAPRQLDGRIEIDDAYLGGELPGGKSGRGSGSAKRNQIRAVNTSGYLKTVYSGIYHAFDFIKYAHRYLAEVQYRFSRRFDLSSILKRLLVASVITLHLIPRRYENPLDNVS